jgi:hypothetical protein
VAERKREKTQAAALGVGGAKMTSNFFARVKEAGQKNASAVRAQAKHGAAQAKDGVAPPPELPFPPPLLARRTAVVPPPLAPLVQPQSADPLHARLQKLIISHFSSEAPGPLFICPGYLLELPQPSLMNYPFELSVALDSAGQPGVSCDIPWSAPDDDSRVRSRNCLLKTPTDGEPCEKCDLLKGNTLLTAALRRAWDTTLHLGQTALSMESHLLNDAGVVIWLRVTTNENELFQHAKSAPSSVVVHKDARC